MTFELEEVARVIDAAGHAPPAIVTGWSVDTRTQHSGDLYFALRGDKLDGHDFVPQAVAKGAVGVVVDHPTGAASQLLVSDTLASLQHLASWARQQWGGTVVAVTGSAGKTTTKDAIAHLLQGEFPVGKTSGNFNNHVGLPLSILRLPSGVRVGILEIGMNHAGEIAALSAIAKPEIGVVTNVGYAHVEFFDSIEGVAAAKRELIEALPGDGVAVLNADDPRVSAFRPAHSGRTVTFGFSENADVRAESVESSERGTRFCVTNVPYETTLAGRHAVMNLLAAIAVARIFGIPLAHLQEPVRTFTVGSMRGERSEHNGVIIWNDCYNSNPEAAKSMIDVLRDTPASRHIAVLGEMLELGREAPELHRSVGRYAAQQGVDLLVAVRGHARDMKEAAVEAGIGAAEFFEDPAAAGTFLREAAKAGDAVLFKASRGVHIEKSLEEFLKEENQR